MVDVEDLELRTLGELQILVGGAQLHLGLVKHVALLVYLTHNRGRVHRREDLAEFLWGASNHRGALHSLSQAIYNLRRHIPDLPIKSRRHEVWLGSAAPIYDLERFRSAVSGKRFEEAEALYRGDFLSGFWVPGAKEFEDWQREQTLELRRLAIQVLDGLVEGASQPGDWERVLALSGRILETDPYNEAVHRCRIRAISVLEGRSEALEEVRLLVELVNRELGHGVDEATLALEDSLYDASSLHERYESDPEVQHLTPVFGRELEYNRYRAIWEGVKCGRGHVLVLIGEPGIGKSRLADNFLRLSAIQGSRILQGRCHTTEKSVSYSAIAGALLSGIRCQDIMALPQQWALQLAHLLPEFLSICGIEMTPLEGEGGQRRLFEAVAQLLMRMSSDSPLVVHIDNFQWADSQSAALVHYCARRLRGSAVLFLLSLRPEGLSVAVPETCSGRDSSEPEYSMIELGPLDRSAVDQIIESYASRHSVRLPPGIGNLIHEQVGGRPFFVLEIIRSIAEGEFDLEFDQRPEQYGASGVIIPSTVEDFLGRKMIRLGPEARRVVSALSVLGDEPAPGLLGSLAEVGHRALTGALDELRGRGFIRDGASGVAFSHELVREAADRSVCPTQRRLLHENAADLLRERGYSNDAVLCLHYSAAGREDLAFYHAMRAAEDSNRVYAYRESENFLKLALCRAPNWESEIRAGIALGDLMMIMGRYGEAAHLFGALIERVEVKEDPGTELSIRSKLLNTAYAQDDLLPEILVDEVTRWSARARELGDHEVHIDLLRLLVRVGHLAGQPELVLGAADDLLPLAQEVGSATHSISALAYSAFAIGAYQGVRMAAPYAEEAVRRAERSRSSPELILALSVRSLNLMQGGRTREAEIDLRRALSLIGGGHGAVSYQKFVLDTYGLLQLEQGHSSEARQFLESAAELARESASSPGLAAARGSLLLVAHESGDRRAAAGLANEIIRSNSKTLALRSTINAWSILGIHALADRDHALAAEYREEIERYADDPYFWSGDVSYAETFMARLNAANGHAQESIERLDRAIEAYADREFFCRLRLKLERASLSVADEPETAARLAEEVRQSALEASAKPLVSRAEGILERVMTYIAP